MALVPNFEKSLIVTSSKEKNDMETGETTSETMLRELGQDPLSPRWNEFVRIYKPVLERFVRYESGRGMPVPEADQDDLVQMTLASLVKTLPNFTYDRKKGRFRGYLRTIVKRMIWNVRRQRAADPVAPYTSVSDVSASSKEEERKAECQKQETRGRICAVAIHLALSSGRVRPETQAIFRRYALEMVPAEEVARQFRTTSNAVRQIKNRVLKIVQSEIKEAGHGAKDLDEILEGLVNKVSRIDDRFRLPGSDRS